MRHPNPRTFIQIPPLSIVEVGTSSTAQKLPTTFANAPQPLPRPQVAATLFAPTAVTSQAPDCQLPDWFYRWDPARRVLGIE